MSRNFENVYAVGLVILLNLTALNSFPRLVFLFLLLPGVLRPKMIIPVYIFASLSSTFYIFQPGLGMGRIIGSLVIIAIIFDLLRTKRKFQIHHRSSIAAMVLFVGTSGLLSGSDSITETIKFLHLLASMLALTLMPNVDARQLIQQLFLGSLIVLGLFYIELGSDLLSGISRRVSISDDVNENRFAMMLGQLSVICFSYIFSRRLSTTSQALAILGSTMAILLMILSGSRSSLFATLMVFLIFLTYQFKQLLPRLIVLGFIAISISTISKLNVSDFVGDALLQRYTLDGLQNSGGSQVRFKVWSSLLPFVINNHLFFGLGFGANNVLEAGAQFGVNKPAHNLILDLFLQIGMIGLTLFTSFFFLLAREIRRNRKNVILIMPGMLLAVTILNGVGESIFMERLLWNNVGLIYLFIKHR